MGIRRAGALALGVAVVGIVTVLQLIGPAAAEAGSSGRDASTGAPDGHATPKMGDDGVSTLPAPAAASLENAKLFDRSATADFYRRPDGTKTAIVFGDAVNWKDATGVWRRVDPTLVEQADGSLRNRSGPVVVRLAGATGFGDVAHIAGDGWSVGYQLVGARGGRPAAVDGARATYRGVADGVDLEYSFNGSALKEVVILQSPAAAQTNSSFRFALSLDGVSPAAAPDGGIDFVAGDGEIVARIPPGIMWDSAEGRMPGDSGQVRLRLHRVWNAWFVAVEPDRAWLADPARVFPVYVDPTTTKQVSTGDSFVFQDPLYETWNFNSYTWTQGYTDFAGYNQSDHKNQYWSLFHYDLSKVQGAQIFSSTWNAYFYNAWHYNNNLYRLRPASTSWAASTVSWKSKPFVRLNEVWGQTTGPGQWGSRDIGSWIANWASGAWPNYGLVVDAPQDKYNVFQIWANEQGTTNRSYLQVNYNTPPAVSGLQPVHQAIVPTLTPTLSARYDENDGDVGDIEYEVYDKVTGALIVTGDGPTVSSGSRSAWTIPAGKLVSQRTYKWRAIANDNFSTSPWTGYYEFTPDTSGPPEPVVTSESHSVAGRWYSNRTFKARWVPPPDLSGISGYWFDVDQSPATRAQTPVYSNVEHVETVPTDGVWYFHVRARDGLNNWGATEDYEFRVDTTRPPQPAVQSQKPPVHADPATWYNDDDVRLRWDAVVDTPSGVAAYASAFDQSASTDPRAPEHATREFARDDVPSGEWWFHAGARDQAGNWSDTAHHRVRIDTVAPTPATITASSHLIGTPSTDRTVDFGWQPGIDAHSGVANYLWGVSPSPDTQPSSFEQTTSTSATTSALADGTWWLHLKTVDAAGNVSAAQPYGPLVVWGVAGAGLGAEPWWTFDGTPVGPQATASVNVANGNLVVQQVDSAPVQAHGDLAYVLRRTYNSQTPTAAAELPGSIGAGWTLNAGESGDLAGFGVVDGRLEVDPAETFSNPAELVLVDRDGTRHIFQPKGAGARVNVTPFIDPAVDGGVLETLVPRALSTGAGNGVHLCADQTYRAPEGVHLSVWRYVQVSSDHATDPCGNPTSGTTPTVVGFGAIRPDRLRAEYLVDGRLLSLTDGNGVELRYRYRPAPDRRLEVVWEARSCTEAALDAPGSTCRAIRFEYPASDRIDVTDPAGRTTSYHLDSHTPRRLVGVTNPDGSTLAYAYGSCAGNDLTLCSVTDPRGNTTSFTYAIGSDSVPRVATITDRRGTTTAYAYPTSTSTTATESGQVRRWSDIDVAGRVAHAEVGPVVGSPRKVTDYTWDAPGSTCRQPDSRPNHNLCGVLRDSLDTSPDQDTTWVYNAEGQRLRERRADPSSAPDMDTTFGWRAQYVQADGSVLVYDDTVDPLVESGTVTSTGAPGRETPQTLFVLSDPTQSLGPRGNAAGAGYVAFLTTTKVDAKLTESPNEPTNGTCADPAAPSGNTGNVCETSGPSSDGTNPTVTRYTYDPFGQRTSMHSPKAIAENLPERTTYTYFADSDLDLSGTVSAGGWLRAVTDPAGEFVAFGYDAGGNTARTWDRNATEGLPAGDFPGSLADPPSPAFTEELRSPAAGPAAYAEPWRYVRSSRDQLGNRTTTTVDANGNAQVTRPPRGNAAGNADFDVTRDFDAGDLMTSELLPEEVDEQKATTFGYDARGNLEVRTDPNGHVRVFRYDEADRRTQEQWTRGTWDPAEAPASCRQSTAPADAPIPAGRILCSSSKTYDGVDNVRSATDGNGKSTTFEYDGVGRETVRLVPRDHDGLTTLRTETRYDLDGHVLRVCGPRQFTEGGGGCEAGATFATHTTYDAAGRPTAVTRYRASGQPVNTTTAYDADGNPKAQTNANGHTTTRAFDLRGRKQSETVPRDATTSHQTTWLYEPSGDLKAVVRPGGIITAYQYDAAHRPIRTVEGADNVDAASAGLTPAGGGSNVRTGVAYDGDGNVVARFDARAFANSSTVPDPRFMARTDYDRNGRAVAQWVPRYDAAAAGDLGLSPVQAAQCPTGAAAQSMAGVPDYPSDVGVCVSRAGYDDAGNRTELRLPTSNGTDGRYVAFGFTDDNLVRVVDAPNPAPAGGRVAAATYRYDALGRRVRVVNALGRTDTFAWTADGLLAEETLQPGAASTHVTKYGYDAAGNRTTVLDAEGHTSTTAYTPDGLVREVVDGGGNRTTYVHDQVGNPTTVKSPSANAQDATNPSGTPTVQEFTRDNLLAAAQQPVAGDGSVQRRTTYGYDPAGRKVSQVSASVDGSGTQLGDAAGAQTFTWSPAGRLVAEVGRDGSTITTSYDPAGNRLSVTDSTNGGDTTTGTWYLDGLPRTVDDGDVTVRYSYDGSGARAARADVDNAIGTQTATSYTYGDAGLPTAMSSDLAAPGSWTFTWDAAGRPDTRTAPNSTTMDWDHGPDDTLTGLTLRGPDGSALTTHSYGYDNLSRIESHAVTTVGAGPAAPLQGTQSFVYDAAGRLDSWQDHTGAGHDVTFDADGNRTRYGDATFTYRADGSIAQSVPSAGAPAVAHAYDDRTGQLVHDGGRCYGYDGFDRTAWAAAKVGTCPAGAAPAGAATYAYDGLDRQRHNTDPALGTTVVRRDGWGSAVTVETGGATPGQAHYALGPNGESFMLRHAVEAEVATHHLHDDGFGTTATVTDGAGMVACTALHDSYGGPEQPAVANPTDAVCNTGQTVNNVWYRGARRDDATGTYQFGSRTYDPAKAGWHTPDSYRAAEPSADLQLRVDPLTQNSYSYVNGDPVNKWDPSGHSMCGYIRNSAAQDKCFQHEEGGARVAYARQRMQQPCAGGSAAPGAVTIDSYSAREGAHSWCKPQAPGGGGGFRFVIELIGFIPGPGDVLDAGLCGFDLMTRNTEEAPYSCIAIVPVIGSLGKIGRWAERADDLHDALKASRVADELLKLPPAQSWGRADTLDEHFHRHGSAFGATSADEYARQASEFLQTGLRRGFPTKVDPKTGVVRIYDSKTNTFASYNPSGTTRTFFKPDPKKHGQTSNWDYWESQPGVDM